MAAKYNPVPFKELAAFLVQMGFKETTIQTKDGQEVVFERAHHGDSQILVLVYTSCSPDGTAVRKRGKDAIRVCLVCESDRVRAVQKHLGMKRTDGRLGLASSKRVNRAGETSSIFSRIRARAQELYVTANRMHRSKHCSCGAPLFPDSGKCVLRGYCKDKAPATEAA